MAPIRGADRTSNLGFIAGRFGVVLIYLNIVVNTAEWISDGEEWLSGRSGRGSELNEGGVVVGRGAF